MWPCHPSAWTQELGMGVRSSSVGNRPACHAQSCGQGWGSFFSTQAGWTGGADLGRGLGRPALFAHRRKKSFKQELVYFLGKWDVFQQFQFKDGFRTNGLKLLMIAAFRSDDWVTTSSSSRGSPIASSVVGTTAWNDRLLVWCADANQN